MNSKRLETYLPNEEALLAFGAKLAEHSTPPCVIFLYGDLGAGKTTLVRGFLRGLGYQAKVKSPTYTLVEAYNLQSKIIYHFDFYRIQDPQELDFIGIQDYSKPSAILLIEWPEKATGLLPTVDLACTLSLSGEGRKLCLDARTIVGDNIIFSML